MNAACLCPSTPSPAPPQPPAPIRADALYAQRRERDLGVGYGRSSGYAAPRGYAPTAALPRFRFA